MARGVVVRMPPSTGRFTPVIQSDSSLARNTAAQATSLVEVLVVVGLLTLGLGLVGSGVFQSISLHRSWREDALATSGRRHTGSWLTTDALNSQTADLVDSGTAVGGTAFSWVENLDDQPERLRKVQDRLPRASRTLIKPKVP